jgi:hypothetical protein
VLSIQGPADSVDELHCMDAMLRIDLYESNSKKEIVLAGKLAGPWVAELERSWEASGSQKVEVDLSRVTFMDDAGKELVFRMRQAGVKFVGTGLIGRFLCKEIEDQIKRCIGPGTPDKTD